MPIIGALYWISARQQEADVSEDTTEQMKLAQAALTMKTEADAGKHHPENEDHADEGMLSKPFADQAPSGAFYAEGQRPVLERSRKVR